MILFSKRVCNYVGTNLGFIGTDAMNFAKCRTRAAAIAAISLFVAAYLLKVLTTHSAGHPWILAACILGCAVCVIVTAMVLRDIYVLTVEYKAGVSWEDVKLDVY